jgi:hypothetical protein
MPDHRANGHGALPRVTTLGKTLDYYQDATELAFAGTVENTELSAVQQMIRRRELLPPNYVLFGRYDVFRNGNAAKGSRSSDNGHAAVDHDNGSAPSHEGAQTAPSDSEARPPRPAVRPYFYADAGQLMKGARDASQLNQSSLTYAGGAAESFAQREHSILPRPLRGRLHRDAGPRLQSAPAVMPRLMRLPRESRVRRPRFVASEQFTVRIDEVNEREGTLACTVWRRRGGGERFFADFVLKEFAPELRPRAVPGAIFYWTLGERIEADGERSSISRIEFRRVMGPERKVDERR